MFKIAKNGKKGMCKAYRCNNKTYGGHSLCPKHQKRLQKEKDPATYSYNALKSNAKRRGKNFTLTLEEFKEFCEENNYIELKGKTKNSASIDRILPDPGIGYTKDNIQVLTLSNNTKKMHEDNKDCPF